MNNTLNTVGFFFSFQVFLGFSCGGYVVRLRKGHDVILDVLIWSQSPGWIRRYLERILFFDVDMIEQLMEFSK